MFIVFIVPKIISQIRDGNRLHYKGIAQLEVPIPDNFLNRGILEFIEVNPGIQIDSIFSDNL